MQTTQKRVDDVLTSDPFCYSKGCIGFRRGMPELNLHLDQLLISLQGFVSQGNEEVKAYSGFSFCDW